MSTFKRYSGNRTIVSATISQPPGSQPTFQWGLKAGKEDPFFAVPAPVISQPETQQVSANGEKVSISF